MELTFIMMQGNTILVINFGSEKQIYHLDLQIYFGLMELDQYMNILVLFFG